MNAREIGELREALAPHMETDEKGKYRLKSHPEMTVRLSPSGLVITNEAKVRRLEQEERIWKILAV